MTNLRKGKLVSDFLSTLSNKYGIHFNERRKLAVNHVNGAALVLAGPGSGKTSVIAAGTAFLIMGIWSAFQLSTASATWWFRTMKIDTASS